MNFVTDPVEALYEDIVFVDLSPGFGIAEPAVQVSVHRDGRMRSFFLSAPAARELAKQLVSAAEKS